MVGAPLADGELVTFRSLHTWPDDAEPPVPYPIECEDCGFRLPSDTEPLPLCPGRREGRARLSRSSPPRRRARLKAVSDERDRKRSSSVTGEKLVFGAVCGWIRDQHHRRCFLEQDHRHRCVSYPGRSAVESCHLDRRARGGRDWSVIDGEVSLRVVPGCPAAHDALDEYRECDGIPHEMIEARAEATAAWLQDRYPGDPPEHVQMCAHGEIV